MLALKRIRIIANMFAPLTVKAYNDPELNGWDGITLTAACPQFRYSNTQQILRKLPSDATVKQIEEYHKNPWFPEKQIPGLFFFTPIIAHPQADTPMSGCHCGSYSYKDAAGLRYEAWVNDMHIVTALVENHGKIIVHNTGYRSQYSTVVAMILLSDIISPEVFCDCEECSTDRPKMFAEEARMADQVADLYSLPRLTRKEILKYLEGEYNGSNR